MFTSSSPADIGLWIMGGRSSHSVWCLWACDGCYNTADQTSSSACSSVMLIKQLNNLASFLWSLISIRQRMFILHLFFLLLRLYNGQAFIIYIYTMTMYQNIVGKKTSSGALCSDVLLFCFWIFHFHRHYKIYKGNQHAYVYLHIKF